MKNQEWTTIDKSEWGPGPWQEECDKKQWVDKSTGLPCLIVRNGDISGSWCGYVGVSSSHPWFNRGYDGCTQAKACEDGHCEHSIDSKIDVHGGLTYSDLCQEHSEERDKVSEAVCHLVEPGDDDNIWWFGFDCAHGFDYMPGMAASNKLLESVIGKPPLRMPGTYRDIAYVTENVTDLARQLAEV